MNTIFKLVYYGTNQKTPPANNQRQRRKSEAISVMFRHLSWTAPAWESQPQEIHRMKETKIAHTVNVRKPEEI